LREGLECLEHEEKEFMAQNMRVTYIKTPTLGGLMKKRNGDKEKQKDVRDTVLFNLQVGRISILNCHATPMLVLLSSSFRHSCYCSDIPSSIYHFFWTERA
jgi:hypothetical protein